MMARNNQRGGKNNNPEGRNQYNSGWMDSARDRPVATAAAAAAAVGAGVFLWSRRNQISDQISNLSEQFSDWTSNTQSGSFAGSGEFETADAGIAPTSSSATGSSRRGGANKSSRGKTGQAFSGTSARSTGDGGTTGGGTPF